MTEEEENEEKRKKTPLTRGEWLTFFFFPLSNNRSMFPMQSLSEDHLKRFKMFGFEKKIEQANEVSKSGTIFYFIVLMAIVIWFMTKYYL